MLPITEYMIMSRKVARRQVSWYYESNTLISVFGLCQYVSKNTKYGFSIFSLRNGMTFFIL
jgi:hypothetical protein